MIKNLPYIVGRSWLGSSERKFKEETEQRIGGRVAFGTLGKQQGTKRSPVVNWVLTCVKTRIEIPGTLLLTDLGRIKKYTCVSKSLWRTLLFICYLEIFRNQIIILK